MSDSNFRTEMAGLARDTLAFIKTWRESKNKHKPVLPDFTFPPEADIDFSDFDVLSIQKRRDRLYRALRAMQEVKVEVDSPEAFVPLLLVETYRLQLSHMMQQTEIDALQTKVRLLEERKGE